MRRSSAWDASSPRSGSPCAWRRRSRPSRRRRRSARWLLVGPEVGCSSSSERQSAKETPVLDRIRVGIVGATVTQGGSGWGANAHVPALKALPQYELKAVCTAHQDTATASAKAFGAERGFNRFSDMAAAPDVDLLVVCVRVPGHRDLVVAGLEAGKPVLCEWPLGKNLAEAEEMAGLARRRSLKSVVGLQARSAPAILYARDLIR